MKLKRFSFAFESFWSRDKTYWRRRRRLFMLMFLSPGIGMGIKSRWVQHKIPFEYFYKALLLSLFPFVRRQTKQADTLRCASEKKLLAEITINFVAALINFWITSTLSSSLTGWIISIKTTAAFFEPTPPLPRLFLMRLAKLSNAIYIKTKLLK